MIACPGTPPPRLLLIAALQVRSTAYVPPKAQGRRQKAWKHVCNAHRHLAAVLLTSSLTATKCSVLKHPSQPCAEAEQTVGGTQGSQKARDNTTRGQASTDLHPIMTLAGF